MDVIIVYPHVDHIELIIWEQCSIIAKEKCFSLSRDVYDMLHR